MVKEKCKNLSFLFFFKCNILLRLITEWLMTTIFQISRVRLFFDLILELLRLHQTSNEGSIIYLSKNNYYYYYPTILETFCTILVVFYFVYTTHAGSSV